MPDPIKPLKDTVLNTLIASIQQALTQAETAETNAEGHETAAEIAKTAAETAQGLAENYKDVAASYANFKGEWADLTGALSIPASVYHDDTFWMLLSDVADVTATEPAAGNADWAELGSGGGAINLYNGLDSQSTEEGATANVAYLLNQKKSEKNIDTVEKTDHHTIAGTDADTVLKMTAEKDYTVPKDILPLGFSVALTKSTPNDVQCLFEEDITTTPASLANGFLVEELPKMAVLYQESLNHWVIVGSESSIQAEVDDLSSRVGTLESTKYKVKGENEFSADFNLAEANLNKSIFVDTTGGDVVCTVPSGLAAALTFTPFCHLGSGDFRFAGGAGVTVEGPIISAGEDKWLNLYGRATADTYRVVGGISE